MNCRDASGSVQCKVDRSREMGHGEPEVGQGDLLLAEQGVLRALCHRHAVGFEGTRRLGGERVRWRVDEREGRR